MRAAIVGFFVALGAIAAYLMPVPAYAQTSTNKFFRG